jgi:hypothetical protein
MITIYGIWAKDVESPSLVTMMFDGKLAQELADASWDFIKNNPHDGDRVIADLEALHGKPDEEIANGMDAIEKRTLDWKSKVALYPYAPEYHFDMFVTDGFAVGPVKVHGTPQFDFFALGHAVRLTALMHPDADRMEGSLSRAETGRRMDTFHRMLSYLTRRR